MNKRQQHLVDSLRRVQAFLDTHGDAVGPLKDTEARKQLDQTVGRAIAHALDQSTAERELAGTGNQAKQLAGDLKTGHMTPVAQFARAKLRGVPNFKALAQVPHSLRGPSLVTAAHAMATAATPYVSHLLKAQFPTESVPQLASAANALGAALADRAAALSRHVIATAGVQEQLALGREAVAMLDPIVTRRLAGKKDLLAGWRSAKRVTQRSPSGTVLAPPVVVPAPSIPAVPVDAPVASVPAAKPSATPRPATAQEVKAA
ncbi:MAG TPA: hypothetical protein VHE78_05060 [Gemmatimonadaceae bacterium]|nr:hypothetical protein [Gemmatimonadaceae bacterium]